METPKFSLIMGFGTFDGLHPGHEFYLSRLREWGEKLVVVIARDRNVERIKGRPAHFEETERLRAVQNLGLAHEVILGHPTDFYEVIRKHQPEAIGLGYDQQLNLEDFQSHFPEIEILRVESHFPEKYKSSLMKKDNPPSPL